MYNNKANKDDKNYDVNILIQYPGIYVTYKLEDFGGDEEDGYDYCSSVSSMDFSESSEESNE